MPRLERYKIHRDKFEVQQREREREIGKASQVFYCNTLDSAIVSSLPSQYFYSPIRSELQPLGLALNLAWTWLKDRYQINEREDIHMLIREWDRVSFDESKWIQEYINDHKNYHQQFRDAKVEIPEVFLMGKILNGLPKRFNNLINRYYQLRKGEGFFYTVANLDIILINFEEVRQIRQSQRWERSM